MSDQSLTVSGDRETPSAPRWPVTTLRTRKREETQNYVGNFARLAEGFLAATQIEVEFFVMYIGAILLIAAAVIRRPAGNASEVPPAQDE